MAQLDILNPRLQIGIQMLINSIAYYKQLQLAAVCLNTTTHFILLMLLHCCKTYRGWILVYGWENTAVKRKPTAHNQQP